MISSPTRNVILAGGAGFVGRHLQEALTEAGYRVTVLSRRPASALPPREGVRVATWNPGKFTGWERELEGAAAVINVAGRSLNCRQTKENRREILRSRINSVRALAEAARRCANPPPVWIQAGSLAFYGDAGPLWCDETAPAGEGFHVEVCRKWEETFFNAPLPSVTRRVMLRIGFVLGNDGGPLPLLSQLARCFAGGPAGNGRQFISWLHVGDLNRIFLRALEDRELTGVFNACTAGPVTNAEFMRELRRLHRRPWSPPIPAPLLKLAAWLTDCDARLALAGRRGLPGRLLEAGFRFSYPALRPALEDLLLPPLAPAPLVPVPAAKTPAPPPRPAEGDSLPAAEPLEAAAR